MSTSTVRNARRELAARLVEVRANLQRLQAEATELLSAVDALDAVLDKGRDPQSAPTGNLQNSQGITTPRQRTPLMPILEQYMAERPGEVMHAAEITKAISASGRHPMGQRDPISTVATSLGRMVKKEKVRKHGPNLFSWIGDEGGGGERSNGAHEEPTIGGATDVAVSDRVPTGT